MFRLFNRNQRTLHIPLMVILMVCLKISIGHAQDLNWVVEPLITEADEIDVEESSQPEINLIKVKQGENWGVKSINNELLLPIEYVYVDIWQGGKYFQAKKKGGKNQFFDFEGYEIDFEDAQEGNKNVSNSEPNKAIDTQLKKLAEEYPMFEFSKMKSGKYFKFVVTNKETGDTISSNFRTRDFFATSKLYSLHYMESEKVVLDAYGNRVKTLDPKLNFAKKVGDRMVFYNKKMKALYDENFNEILPLGFDKIFFINEDYLKVSKDGQPYYIVDKDGNEIPNSSGPTIFEKKDGTIIIKKEGYETGMLNPETGVVKIYDWRLRNRRMSELNVQHITNKDTLSGLYDLAKGEVILDCQYRKAHTVGTLFIGTKDTRRLNRRMSYDYTLKTIHDINGKKIIEDSILTVKEVGPNLIFTIDIKRDITEYDNQGNVRKKHPTGYDLKTVDNQFISVQPKGETHFVHIKDYLSGNQTYSYDVVSKPNLNKEKTKYVYKVIRNGKAGAVDQHNAIVLPIVFDELNLEGYSSKYLTAKFQGKWGVLHNPLYKVD